VWGKLEDAASRLRCACAHAVVDANLSGPAALRELVPHLVDEIGAVRVDTVRAISEIGGDEAALLLRLKAYAGDEEPEVVGECFAGILDREPDAAVAFIASFLANNDDAVKAEAASALALARDPAALEHLSRFLTTTLSPELRAGAVTACAASPQPGIVDLLFTIVEGDDWALAATAIRALAESRFRSHARERARVAARRNGLGAVYAEAFGSETPEDVPS
jgi:HEAT repeat protein